MKLLLTSLLALSLFTGCTDVFEGEPLFPNPFDAEVAPAGLFQFTGITANGRTNVRMNWEFDESLLLPQHQEELRLSIVAQDLARPPRLFAIADGAHSENFGALPLGTTLCWTANLLDPESQEMVQLGEGVCVEL